MACWLIKFGTSNFQHTNNLNAHALTSLILAPLIKLINNIRIGVFILAINRETLYRMIAKMPDEKLEKVAFTLKKVYEEDGDELSLKEKAEIAEAEKRIANGEHSTIEELFEKYGEYDV